jgi:CRP-like cAMP-binding protein
MVGPSRLTGEECLGSAAFHSATAQAVSASHIVSIRRDDVLRLMRSVAGVSERIVESLLQARLRVQQRAMAQQSLQAQCRFATMLWDIAVPVPGSRSRVIGVPLTHERLAELLGTTRPRVTVLMNRFMRLGYVHESGGQLVINPSISVATNPRRGAPKRGDALRGILDSIRASDPFVRSGDQGD